MTIGSGLLFVTLVRNQSLIYFDKLFTFVGNFFVGKLKYQKRQPTTLPGVYQVYSYFAGIIFLNLISLVQPPQESTSSVL